MSIDPALYSSANTSWETPDDLFAYWDHIFNFDLDVCASPENTKVADCYFTEADNGLVQSWGGFHCWMNPPYGAGISLWVQKAVREAELGALVCCLLPARTDTRWWQGLIGPHASLIKFLPGRLRFKGAKSSAPFPSAIVVFLPSVVH